MLQVVLKVRFTTVSQDPSPPTLDNPLHKGLYLDGKRRGERKQRIYAGAIDVLAALLKLLYCSHRHAGAFGKLALANRLVRAPRGWNGDGALVTLRGDAETSRFVEGLVKAHIPVVDLTSYMPEVNVPRVIPDYMSAGASRARISPRSASST